MANLTEQVAQLTPRFSGLLLQPSDAGYDAARKIHNGLIDKRPALIARCRNLADVADAVNLGRAQGLEIAVRGGGHNVAGRATVDAGLMIDLATMKGIHVDAKARTARVQGGVTWKELNRETQVHALATTGGIVGSTGVAGLTLGGGFGWLMPKHAMALDNLQSVDIVTADGRALHASREEHPDLFWAVRGGGGNFGVVTSFEFRLHPVGPMVTGGLVAHPFARAREVYALFRDQAAAASDDVMLVCALIHAPDGSGAKLIAIAAGHCGALADAESALRPIKTFGPPVMDAMGPIPYNDLNGMLDGGFPPGALSYWKSHFMSELSDEAIGTLMTCYEACPSPTCQILVEHFHGAATRVGVSETAFALRSAGFNLLILGHWMDPRDTEKCTAWVRETYAAMQPFVGSMRYLNYLGDDEGDDPAAAAYGPNYRRLRDLKAKYDAENIFHLNLNIRPLI